MNPDSFNLSTDYPIDKVIYRSPITPLSISPGDASVVSIPNTTGVAFLPIIQYSTSPTFATNVYDVGTSPSSGGVQTYNTSGGVTSTEITYGANNNTPSPITLYFRTVGLELVGTSGEVQTTQSYQDFVLNTDNNYMKIVKQDIITLPNNTCSTVNMPNVGSSEPRVMVWLRYSNSQVISQHVFAGVDFTYGDSGLVVLFNDSQVTFKNADTFGTLNMIVYYKIYSS